jgi:hypothetical protein
MNLFSRHASALLASALSAVACAQGAVITDPTLATGPEALDPVSGPMAGRQNVTHVANGASRKEALLAVPGFAVMQSFEGFDGAVKSPVNRVEFTGGRPSVTFTINSTTGYGGVASGAGDVGAFTSGPAQPAVGESIYIGSTINDLRYEMEFSEPVAAAGFTIARTLGTTGSEPVWSAAFFAADGTLLSRQSASVGHAPNVAALFGHVAAPGRPIARVVFGKDERSTHFLMGNAQIFLDDFGFAPLGAAGGASSVSGAAAVGPAQVGRGVTVGAWGETVDIQAPNSTPRSFMENLASFGEVRDWATFSGIPVGSREVINSGEWARGVELGFHLRVQADGAEGCGGPTSDPALYASPRQALRIGGRGGTRRLEITANRARSEGGGPTSLYAVCFTVTNVEYSEIVATFFNAAGQVLSVQRSPGAPDPANADNPPGRRGAEIHFGLMADARQDRSRWVHRIWVEDRGSEEWGLDDFGFATEP